MAKRKKDALHPNVVGSWAFIIGLVLALALGLGLTGTYQKYFLWAVFLLGIAVGLLNIKVDEVTGFLHASTVLVIVAFFGLAGGIFTAVAPAITNMLLGILTLFVPATIIVALRAVFVYARQ